MDSHRFKRLSVILPAALALLGFQLGAAASESEVSPEDIAAIARAAEEGSLGLASRFTDHGNGTVTDELTGLIWLADGFCFGKQNWANAVAKAAALFDGCSNCGVRTNDCGLADGSGAGEWRLPNQQELESLMEPLVEANFTLPSSHPFANVLQLDNAFYWSSTAFARDANAAWGPRIYLRDPNARDCLESRRCGCQRAVEENTVNGHDCLDELPRADRSVETREENDDGFNEHGLGVAVGVDYKTHPNVVWPVRGGQ
jgi:hypothetical protein